MRFGICGVGFAAILAFFLVVAAGETAGEYEEYHTVDMQPLDKVNSPIGKNPLGFCYRIHSEGSHQYSEDSFSEIVANLMHDLMSMEGASYFPVLCMTPGKKALLGTTMTVPHIAFVRTLYTISESLIRSMVNMTPEGGEELKMEVNFPTVNMYQTNEIKIETEETPVGPKTEFIDVMPRVHGPKSVAIAYDWPKRVPWKKYSAAWWVPKMSKYNLVLTGSTAAAATLRAEGVQNVEVLPQGIDTTRFFPSEGPDVPVYDARIDGMDYSDQFEDRFVIYSSAPIGLPWGQDLMMEAFKIFHATHSEALLVHNWGNPYAVQTEEIVQDLDYRTLCDSPYVKKCLRIDVEQTMGNSKIIKARFPVEKFLEDNGISLDDSFMIYPRMNTTAISELYRRVDAAVFPYTFSATPNKEAMRLMASGAPVVLSKTTGQLDLTRGEHCYPISAQRGEDALEPHGDSAKIVAEIVQRLNEIYDDRELARRKGKLAAEFMRNEYGSEETTRKFMQLLDKYEFGVEDDAATVLMMDASSLAKHTGWSETDMYIIGGSVTVLILCVIYLLNLRSRQAQQYKQCKEWLEAYYRKKAPSKLGDVDKIVAAFSGDIDRLRTVVMSKYEGESKDKGK